MTCIIKAESKRRVSAKLSARIATFAFLTLATFVASASAEEHRGGDRGGDHRDRGHGQRGGGYYLAPPVVYGSPYYAPPPVVYGPAIGVYLPGVSIGIL
jgi:hypothetical protein